MSDSESAAVIQNLIDAGYDPYRIADFQNLVEKKDVKGPDKTFIELSKVLIGKTAFFRVESRLSGFFDQQIDRMSERKAEWKQSSSPTGMKYFARLRSLSDHGFKAV